MKLFNLILILAIVIVAFSCNTDKAKELSKIEKPLDTLGVVATPPDWSKNATIYEVNLRQYTKEGTINAFIPNLQRLKDLGIDILWIMPPYPIGEKNRKGVLGSPYSISDYTEINPDLGTKQDFKNLVEEAHKLGLKVILDWVGNHTAFDHKWTVSHPDWYTKDSLGNITYPPTTDWTDVADLNYDNPDMRKEMIKDMEYWVKDFDIDGYRCDVAGFVPNDFWSAATDSLNKVKPNLFMLAEWDDPSLHYSGFNMTYGWELHHILNEIAKGKMEPIMLDSFQMKDSERYPKEAYRMNFTTNHDENSWNGTVYERMGKAADAMTVLAFTWQGMPLVYSGQEAGLNKRLSFFDKDEID
ncbi:MAG: alpha-amylase family glycosyl hydrolase [Saprospiraceae bacterium]